METKELNLRSSTPASGMAVKKVEDFFREFSSDITNFQRKLDIILDCVFSVLDNMEHFETSINAIENKNSVQTGSSSYAEVAFNNLI